MYNTVLSDTDLSDANFFEADLSGARFDRAVLHLAKFAGARNIPVEIQEKLDESGVYRDTENFRPTQKLSSPTPARVFLSRPGCLSYPHQRQIVALLEKLCGEGLDGQTLERPDYPNFGAISEVRRIMSGCVGAIITGFPELRIQSGSWRSGTQEEKRVENLAETTPWSQIEGGMAVMLGIPILLLRGRCVSGGLFDVAQSEPDVYQVFVDEDWNSKAFLDPFLSWCADARERARLPKA